MSVVIRERLAHIASLFERIEVALFSTFNFNADFFEQNVFPALFGVEPQSSRAALEQRVHRGLRQTEVGVFCDPAVIKPSSGVYRYSVYPVFVPRRFFHPKNIILIGRDRQDKRWVYVAVTSANLSLSGWGRQCEGFADTWLPAPIQQPMLELKNYLAWLDRHIDVGTKNGPLPRAISLLHELGLSRKVGNPEHTKGPRSSPRLYFSPLHESLWHFVRKHYGSIRAVKAASPYWGDATRVAALLPKVNWTLIAARKPPLMTEVYLGKDTLQRLCADGNGPQAAVWKDPTGRFHHIKLYEFQTSQGTVTAIGSCNFTNRGQFWLDAEGLPQGNVESMLLESMIESWPDTERLSMEQMPPASEGEDAPQPWPFYVSVVYDWQIEEFSCQLHADIPSGQVSLDLRDGQPAVVLDTHSRMCIRQGDLKSRSFLLHWEAHSQEGIITEVNLQSSTQVYGRALSTQEILESWRSGLSFEPQPAEPDEDGQERYPKTKGSTSEASELVFDAFELFQALKARRERLAILAPGDEQLELLLHRSDSVAALARAFKEANISETAKWIVYRECRRFFNDSVDEGGRRFCGLLDGWIGQIYPSLLQTIAQELQGKSNVEPGRLLEWYEYQLTGVRP